MVLSDTRTLVLFKAQLGETFLEIFDLFVFHFLFRENPSLKTPKPALKHPNRLPPPPKIYQKDSSRHLNAQTGT